MEKKTFKHKCKYNYFWITNSQTKSVITTAWVYTRLITVKHACKNMCSCTKNDQIHAPIEYAPKRFFLKTEFYLTQNTFY